MEIMMPQPLYSPLRGKRSEVTLLAFLAKALPYHQLRVEPMFYSGSMLLAINDPPAAEIINDMGGLLGDFWRTMRDDADFQRFYRICNSTPYCESAFREARLSQDDPDPVKRAWAFFIMNRQGYRGDNNRFEFITKNRTRRFMTEQASAYLSAIDHLHDFHERLRSTTYFSGRNPLDLIHQFDSPETLFVLTPKTSDKPLSSLFDLFPSEDDPDGFFAHKVMLHLLGKVLVVLESGQPIDADFSKMGWNKLDFETRKERTWTISPRKPSRLWANFSFPSKLKCKCKP
jgi:DNA adenine methylase